MPLKIQRLPKVGTQEIPVDLSHEGDPPEMPPRETTSAVLGEAFETGTRAGARFFGFRHTHIAWLPPESAVDDPGPTKPTWMARIDGQSYRVMLVQPVNRGQLPGRKKAWLLRTSPFAQTESP